MEPAFIPEYRKPDVPGIAFNVDNSVSIYIVVSDDDGFETAANEVFGLLNTAQQKYPDRPRLLFLEIDGHEGAASGFDEDFFEFQQEFWFSAIAPFVTAFETPLAGSLLNPESQRNDLPDELVVRSSGSQDSQDVVRLR